jgi:predicted oxidoreductase
MGAVGASADNAAAEAFNATLKRETLQGVAAGPTAANQKDPCQTVLTRVSLGGAATDLESTAGGQPIEELCGRNERASCSKRRDANAMRGDALVTQHGSRTGAHRR